MGGVKLFAGGLTYRTRFARPVEMSGDGVAGGSDCIVMLLVLAKARKLRPELAAWALAYQVETLLSI